MNSVVTNKNRGFTIVELVVAMAVGLIVMAAATQLFESAMTSTRYISQRAEMEQNVRAALNIIAKDASMAGSGLQSGGFSLPYGGGATVSLRAVDQGGTVYINNNGYPPGTTGNWMYGLVPGPNDGLQRGGPVAIPAMPGQTDDAATFIYTDYAFPLSTYNTVFTDDTGIAISLAVPAAPPPNLPPILSPTGLVVGDLIMINAGGIGESIGEITGINAGGTVVTFAPLDPLNVNQASPSGSLHALAQQVCPSNKCPVITNSGMTATRVYAVTYFLQVPAAAGTLPRLMRQVNGQTPVPVADNIIGLHFTYDLCNGSNAGCAGIQDLIAAGYVPSQVDKVNITVIGQSLLNYGNKSQSEALTTSVSTRSLTFKNIY